MAHSEEILHFLRGSGNAYCDDCLSERLKIFPRQAVNRAARKLFAEGKLLRRKGDCAGCYKRKLVNQIKL